MPVGNGKHEPSKGRRPASCGGHPQPPGTGRRASSSRVGALDQQPLSPLPASSPKRLQHDRDTARESRIAIWTHRRRPTHDNPLSVGNGGRRHVPVNMGAIGQIGSHLGNTGPFWQIRVPLDRLGSHWGFCGSPLIRLRVPPAAITGPIRRTVMGIYAEGAIESEPPPPRPPAGSPLPP